MPARKLEIFGASGDRPIISGDRKHHLNERSYYLQRRDVTLNNESQRMQRRLKNQSEKIKKLQSELKRARRDNNPRALSRLQKELNDCQKSRSGHEQALSQLRQDIANCEKEKRDLEIKLRGEQKEHRFEKTNSISIVKELQIANTQLQQALSKCQEEKKQIQTLKEENLDLKKRLDQVSTAPSQGQSQLLLGIVRQNLEQSKSQISSLEQALEREKIHVDALRQENETLKTSGGSLAACQIEFAALEAELNKVGDENERLRASNKADTNALQQVQKKLIQRNKKLEEQNKAQTKTLSFLRMNQANDNNRHQATVEKLLQAQIGSSGGESKMENAEVSALKQQLRVSEQQLNKILQSIEQKVINNNLTENKLERTQQELNKAQQALAACNPEEMNELKAELKDTKTFLSNFQTLATHIKETNQPSGGESKEDPTITKLNQYLAAYDDLAGGYKILSEKIIEEKETAMRDMNQAISDKEVVQSAIDVEKKYSDEVYSMQKKKLMQECEQKVNNQIDFSKKLRQNYDSAKETYEKLVKTLKEEIEKSKQALAECEESKDGNEEKIETLENEMLQLEAKLDEYRRNFQRSAPVYPYAPAPVPAPVPATPVVVVNPSLTPDQQEAIIGNIRQVLRWYALENLNPKDPQLRFRVREEINWIKLRSNAGVEDGAFQILDDLIGVDSYRDALAAYLKAMWKRLTGVAYGNDSLLGATWYAMGGLVRKSVTDIENILRDIDKRFNQKLLQTLRAQDRNDDIPRLQFQSPEPDPYGGGGASKNNGGGGGGGGGSRKRRAPVPAVVVPIGGSGGGGGGSGGGGGGGGGGGSGDDDDDDDDFQIIKKGPSRRSKDWMNTFDGPEWTKAKLKEKAEVFPANERYGFELRGEEDMRNILRRLYRDEKVDINGNPIETLELQPRLIF